MFRECRKKSGMRKSYIIALVMIMVMSSFSSAYAIVEVDSAVDAPSASQQPESGNHESGNQNGTQQETNIAGNGAGEGTELDREEKPAGGDQDVTAGQGNTAGQLPDNDQAMTVVPDSSASEVVPVTSEAAVGAGQGALPEDGITVLGPILVDNAEITVTALDFVFDRGVQISASVVKPEQTVVEALNQQLAKENQKLEAYQVFDITLVNSAGEAVQLQGNVAVSIKTAVIPEDSQETGVYFVPESDKKDSDELIKDMNGSLSDGAVEFETTHFSQYMVYSATKAAAATGYTPKGSSKWDAGRAPAKETSANITHKKQESGGYLYTIDESAKGNLIINLSDIVPLPKRGYYMPGDTLTTGALTIKNDSGRTYAYKQNSVVVQPFVIPESGAPIVGTGFDGQKITVDYSILRTLNGAVKALYDNKRPTAVQWNQLYEKLAEKGYAGGYEANALSAYFRDYYGKGSVTYLDDLSISSMAAITDGNYYASGAQHLKDEDVSPYVQDFGFKQKENLMCYEAESDIAAMAWNFFYNFAASVTFDQTKYPVKNAESINEYAIGMYMRNIDGENNQARNSANAVLGTLQVASGQEIQFADMAYHLDGPQLQNVYVTYKFGFDVYIELEDITKDSTGPDVPPVDPTEPGTGGGNGGGDRDPIIRDEEIPAGPAVLPDEEIPAGPISEEPVVVVPEEQVPAGALPKTGGVDPGMFFGFGALISMAGLGLRKKQK